MRKEYDFSKGERGKFYGKVDTRNSIIEIDDEVDEKLLTKSESLMNKLPQDENEACDNL